MSRGVAAGVGDLRIPDHHLALSRSASHQGEQTILAEGHPIEENQIQSFADGEQFLTGGRVPDPDRFIHADGSQTPAIGTESQAGDGSGVPLANAELLAGVRVPDPDELAGTGGQTLAVRTESDTLDRPLVSLEVQHLLAHVHVPDAKVVVPADGKLLAIVAKGQTDESGTGQ